MFAFVCLADLYTVFYTQCLYTVFHTQMSIFVRQIPEVKLLVNSQPSWGVGARGVSINALQ